MGAGAGLGVGAGGCMFSEIHTFFNICLAPLRRFFCLLLFWVGWVCASWLGVGRSVDWVYSWFG